MFRTLSAVNTLLGTLVGLAVVVLVAAVGWLGYSAYSAEKWALEQTENELAQREARIQELTENLEFERGQIQQLTKDLGASRKDNQRLKQEVAAQKAEIERLETSVRLLKVDRRIAEIRVLSRQGSPLEDNLITKISFVEIDGQGKALEKPRVFNIQGDVVYVDAWVIKFDDKYVERGDPLRSTSICLFRRIFGEAQQPKDGFVLDAVGSRPIAYHTGGKISKTEQEIWSRFWEYANDPAKAKKAGMRAVHGEAPSIKLVPGRVYKILLRASGGLSITAGEPIPDQDPRKL